MAAPEPVTISIIHHDITPELALMSALDQVMTHYTKHHNLSDDQRIAAANWLVEYNYRRQETQAARQLGDNAMNASMSASGGLGVHGETPLHEYRGL